VEIADSARKHGIADADILHALDHAIWRGLQRYDEDERVIVIGPSRTGALLELVIRPALAPNTVIHADRAREKFLRHLR
jgi:hypothetical protein